MHIYVDRSLVTVIVDNATSISVWVHPQQMQSVSVKLFGGGGEGEVVAETIDVWQLAKAHP
jgi:hypothetical protein